jgi:hypothetical protein
MAQPLQPRSQNPREIDGPPTALRLQTLPPDYPLGYPVAVRFQVQNLGNLSCESSLLQTMKPCSRPEHSPRKLYRSTLANLGGRSRTREAMKFEPGCSSARIAGEALFSPASVRVSAPTTDADRAVLRALLNERGEMDDAIGRTLFFGGRIGSRSTLASLETSGREYGHTALGSALRLSLISQRLRRTGRPSHGRTPAC